VCLVCAHLYVRNNFRAAPAQVQAPRRHCHYEHRVCMTNTRSTAVFEYSSSYSCIGVTHWLEVRMHPYKVQHVRALLLSNLTGKKDRLIYHATINHVVGKLWTAELVISKSDIINYDVESFRELVDQV
jgi:hypothetical protein